MNREAVYNGGPMSPFWWYDRETRYHNRFAVTLDHPVDPGLLEKAWDYTKRVYPLIDCVPDRVDGEIVFYRDGGKNAPILSAEPVSPGTRACAGRAFALTWHGSTVAMSSFHSVVDGGGINAIFSTLLYTYLSLYTGEHDAEPPVELRENRAPGDYYVSLSAMEPADFVQQPMIAYAKRKGMFIDLDMAPDADGNITLAQVRVPVDSFMAACRGIGANPSAMMTILMARAAWQLHPDRHGDLAFVLTMSARKAFGIPDTIANCSANLLIPVAYDTLMGGDPAAAAREIRAVIEKQRSADYIRTLAAFYETYDWILAKRYAVLTYIGSLNLGMHTKHIRGFEMTDDATCSMYMMELNGEFVISFQLGRVTGKYMETITGILSEFGVPAAVVSPPHPVMKDRGSPAEEESRA